MQHTQNYQLSRWEKDDRIMMEDFNADNETIDAALAAKADAEDITALGETVAALTAGLGSGGRTARIAWGSYTGNDQAGPNYPSSLSFDFKPVWVYIVGYSSQSRNLYEGVFLRPSVWGSGYVDSLSLTWTDRGVSWYAPDGVSVGQSSCQLNMRDYTYHYIVFGAAE